MSRHIALLRAVNVGGRGAISMADLKAVAEKVGLGEVSTLLASGNLLFSATAQPCVLEAELEQALAKSLGLDTQVMVRTAAQWQALIAANPFIELAKGDPTHLVLLVLKGKAAPGAEAALRAAITGPEEVVVMGDAAFVAYPAGIGRSKLTSAVLQRHLGTEGTGRNWSTVLKIAAKLGA